MNLRKFSLHAIALLILCSLLFASISDAKIMGPNTITADGIVTGIDLQAKWVAIDGKTYNLADNPVILDWLRSHSIQISDKVKITLPNTVGENKLISIQKPSDTNK